MEIKTEKSQKRETETKLTRCKYKENEENSSPLLLDQNH